MEGVDPNLIFGGCVLLSYLLVLAAYRNLHVSEPKLHSIIFFLPVEILMTCVVDQLFFV
jgi:hypothetical protein